MGSCIYTFISTSRGVRQGDPISPKLFTAAIEDIFRKAELTDGIDMDGETLTDLRFADDVALLTKTPQQMESQMNTLNNISKTVGRKMHKGKTKLMINYSNQDSLCIENEEIKKVEHYKYLCQTTYLRETTIYSQTCLNGHLFHPATCLSGQFSVTPSRFYSLFAFCITVAPQRGHGQPICTPK